MRIFLAILGDLFYLQMIRVCRFDGTVSWFNVDTPRLFPTPFFKDRNNKKDRFIDRKNSSSLIVSKISISDSDFHLIPNTKGCRN